MKRFCAQLSTINVQDMLNSITAIKKGFNVLWTGAMITEEMTFLSQVT
jgi:hypothetical protein